MSEEQLTTSRPGWLVALPADPPPPGLYFVEFRGEHGLPTERVIMHVFKGHHRDEPAVLTTDSGEPGKPSTWKFQAAAGRMPVLWYWPEAIEFPLGPDDASGG